MKVWRAQHQKTIIRDQKNQKKQKNQSFRTYGQGDGQGGIRRGELAIGCETLVFLVFWSRIMLF